MREYNLRKRNYIKKKERIKFVWILQVGRRVIFKRDNVISYIGEAKIYTLYQYQGIELQKEYIQFQKLLLKI